MFSLPLGGVVPITYERVLQNRNCRPRRISFMRTRQDEPKRTLDGSRWVGSFSVPFEKTVKPIFEAATGLALFSLKQSFSGQNPGFWRSIRTAEEFEQIQNWVNDQSSRVFLRDCLDLSIALDLNFEEGGGPYTILGKLEHEAKVNRDLNAMEVLSSLLIHQISQLPFYQKASAIMAVPPAKGKTYDLPSLLAGRVASELSKENLTSAFTFEGEKGQVKDCILEEKWPQLEAANLHYSGSGLNNCSVILIDDKYQSGTTMQFVGMKLQQAGAKRIFGISLVKTLGDGDNVATK